MIYEIRETGGHGFAKRYTYKTDSIRSAKQAATRRRVFLGTVLEVWQCVNEQQFEFVCVSKKSGQRSWDDASPKKSKIFLNCARQIQNNTIKC